MKKSFFLVFIKGKLVFKEGLEYCVNSWYNKKKKGDIFVDFESYLASLPKALDKEEQKRLLELFYKTRDPKIREKLISHNLRMVAICVKKFRGLAKDLEDLMTIGTLELINIIDNTYDISKGTELSSFAMKSIFLKLYASLNTSRTSDAMNCLQKNTIFDKESQEEEDIIEAIESDVDVEKDIAFKDYLERFLKTLSEYERYLLLHKHGLFNYSYQTYAEMGQKWGVAPQKIKIDVDNVEIKLRDYYLNQDKNKHSKKKDYASLLEVTDNEKHKLVIEHLYGLNGKKLMTSGEIEKELNATHGYVWYVLNKLKERRDREERVYRRNDITDEDVLKYIRTCNNPRDINILELHYGLNGNKKHTRNEIAEIYNVNYGTINAIIRRLNGFIYKNKQSPSTKVGIVAKMHYLDGFYNTITDETERKVFAHIYGIAGYEKLKPKDLVEALDLNIGKVYKIINKVEKRLQDYIREDCMQR